MSSASPPAVQPPRPTSLVESPRERESAITRLLIAPLTFFSFILTLALIDHRNTSLRGQLHNVPQPPAPDTFIGWIKGIVHGCIYRPQPYAYVQSPAGLVQEKSGGERDGGQVKDEAWHWRSKQRKMIKAEVEDAFEMRRKVVVAMMVALVGLTAGLVWCVSWVRAVMKKSL